MSLVFVLLKYYR